MKLKVQKRIAADILDCSGKKVVFDTERLKDIKEAITKADLRTLIKEKAIKKEQDKGVSRVRAKKRQIQRTKGRQRGQGKRKGTANARAPKKRIWINKVRLQRNFLKELREKKLLSTINFRMLYMKIKGGFFRSRKHLKNYTEEHKLFLTKKSKTESKSKT
ncbi:50S ribosomal protein L19e [Candidatus Woesearchaeota archaeon]|jgi:large subunit ribosomal protein L19e|nr:50S ribosomal protein L19e [Candidatus Woesearchaeota archaeon]MBT5271912.1 50S ribosomal protein L19e [Candidatus Woesearchaeota archaeon]MBT6041024.1 50S ribosomal protein L19e [Candidatus Woesearchaeota archaeon]MBT6336200.1 50S ribosomal protein L19e [Candidatus Woesearchaeota archaeon]MBT7928033.1 50S ribosomal protein L19e [Candidatus Woesearchaeota archaeon]